jgi:hypothetical protein
MEPEEKAGLKPERCREKEQLVLERSLDEWESIQTEDEAKNVLVTIINLVTNSGDAEAMLRRLWKAVELHVQHDNKIQQESTNSDCSWEL